jgi:hypothetical protein
MRVTTTGFRVWFGRGFGPVLVLAVATLGGLGAGGCSKRARCGRAFDNVEFQRINSGDPNGRYLFLSRASFLQACTTLSDSQISQISDCLGQNVAHWQSDPACVDAVNALDLAWHQETSLSNP